MTTVDDTPDESVDQPGPTPGRVAASAARLDTADVLRRLGHAIVAHEAGDEVLNHVRAEAEQLLAAVEATPDRIRTPLFIAQGANDPRVNKAESDQVVEALRKRGVAVEYMVKANEGHGFQNEENRMDFYGAMEKFLARYLKP